ncbi:MAG TPA: CRTAC1 family protein [Candidatus Latescibacteria bacterium]|nr:CRTAC1 family protein [Candidatus Latescibacterota bacterium]
MSLWFGLFFIIGAWASPVRFTEVTEEVGVIFLHRNGSSGRYYHPETHGGGAAWLDYDNDGYIDLYVVNSAELPGCTYEVKPINRLYRNNGDGTFTDVTFEARVGDPSYGIGCSVADYDNDGHMDIYVTNLGPNKLYHNNGDGTFADVTDEAGVGDAGMGVGSVWLDYNNDGFLDLFVGNYIDSPIEKNRWCGIRGIRLFCSPRVFDGAYDLLYRNNGDGTFTDVTKEAELYRNDGRDLGVVCLDYDNDGDMDIYVANDQTPNFLYRNDGDGTFAEVGLEAGVAVSREGIEQAGMGVDAGDYDNDGDMDLIVGNFQQEAVVLYRNEGGGVFEDVSFEAGIGMATLSYLTFGIGFFDYDNDGYQDIFMANGHVHYEIAKVDPAQSYPQRDLLFHNNGDGTFTDVSRESGEYFRRKYVGRGTAFGDYDNDGDIDIFVVNSNQKAILLRNDGGNRNHWISLKLVGTRSNRNGIGARVKVWAGHLFQMDELKSGSSYACQDDLRMHFGLGKMARVDSIEIRWPSGVVQRLRGVKADQFLTVVEPP